MDIAQKISDLNTETEELKKSIAEAKAKIVANNAKVRKLATQLKNVNEILGIQEPVKEEA